MYILGLNCFYHDSAAALLKDGQPVAIAEEERFSRLKHDTGFPKKAIRFCLDQAGISIHDVDHVAIYMKPGLIAKCGLRHALRHPRQGLPYAMGLGYSWLRHSRIVKYLDHEFDAHFSNGRGKVSYVEHHIAHAASAFFSSPYDEAAILSVDGAGEIDCTVLAEGRGREIRKLKAIPFPHSLGMFYSSMTKYLGFQPDNDEYKVMGLSSYGKPTYTEELRDLVRLLPGGEYRIALDYFDYWSLTKGKNWYGPRLAERFGPARTEDEPVEERHMDFAASAQLVLEEAVFHILKELRKLCDSPNLCMAGGVVMNCVMNGKVLHSGIFDSLFVQPVAYDAGTALGAALYTYRTLLGGEHRFRQDNLYFGPEFSDEQIKATIDLCKITSCERVDDIAARTAKLVADGKIVGWFQGRLEFGARALGSRSILANPCIAEMKDLVNKFVKHREEFRPFAPSVLEEKAAEYFDLPVPSPYMAMVCDVHEDKHAVVPAITHVDGTGRAQTVNQNTNPLYYRMIQEFEKLTGVPLVLNTSFNVRGEPIVCTPADAIRCFFSTGLDYLVLGNYLISK